MYGANPFGDGLDHLAGAAFDAVEAAGAEALESALRLPSYLPTRRQELRRLRLHLATGASQGKIHYSSLFVIGDRWGSWFTLKRDITLERAKKAKKGRMKGAQDQEFCPCLCPKR